MKKHLNEIKSLLKSKGISIEDYSEIGYGKNSKSYKVFSNKQIYFLNINESLSNKISSLDVAVGVCVIINTHVV